MPLSSMTGTPDVWSASTIGVSCAEAPLVRGPGEVDQAIVVRDARRAPGTTHVVQRERKEALSARIDPSEIRRRDPAIPCCARAVAVRQGCVEQELLRWCRPVGGRASSTRTGRADCSRPTNERSRRGGEHGDIIRDRRTGCQGARRRARRLTSAGYLVPAKVRPKKLPAFHEGAAGSSAIARTTARLTRVNCSTAARSIGSERSSPGW